MNAPSYTITSESVTIVWKGEPHTVQSDSPNYAPLCAAIHAKNWDGIEGMLTVTDAIENWSDGEFALVNEDITYKGKPVPPSFATRLLNTIQRGEEARPLLRFFERLSRNPSFRSVEQLFTFLQHCNIPLTQDGCFLAYKGVTTDYKDCHTQSVDNSPGCKPEPIPRNEVSDDPRTACHRGYHVGALGYATSFGQRTVICKVDPEHVVCVPYDFGNQKMRVTEYEVIGKHGVALPSTTNPTRDLPKTPPKPVPVEEAKPATTEEAKAKATKTPAPKAKVKAELDLTTNIGTTVKVVERDEGEGFDPKEVALWESYDGMDTEALLDESSFNLRRYALHHLGVVGGGRIKGGKVPLVTVICKVRDNQ